MDAFTGCHTSDRFFEREAFRRIFRPVMASGDCSTTKKSAVCVDIINLVTNIHVNKLQWAGNVVRMVDNRNLEEMTCLPTGKRRKRWEDEVTKDAVKSLNKKNDAQRTDRIDGGKGMGEVEER